MVSTRNQESIGPRDAGPRHPGVWEMWRLGSVPKTGSRSPRTSFVGARGMPRC